MKQKRKRRTALAMAVLLLFSSVPDSAFAETGAPERAAESGAPPQEIIEDPRFVRPAEDGLKSAISI